MATEFPKVHGCGVVIEDLAAWKRLPFRFIQPALLRDDPEDIDLECRDCPCGSTLAVPLTEVQ